MVGLSLEDVSVFGSSGAGESSLSSGVGLGGAFSTLDLRGVGEAFGFGFDFVLEAGVVAGFGFGRGVAAGVGLLTGSICSLV